MSVDRSRPLKLAAQVAGEGTSDLASYLDDSVVVVTMDPSMPLALLTTRVMLTTLRRGLGHLNLVDTGDLPRADIDALIDAVAAIDPDGPIRVIRPSDPVSDHAVRVHVGPTAATRAIRITPEGYGAHVASSPAAIIQPVRPPNPIGSIFTAALGAAEVFKHVARVLPARHVIHDHLRFCPLALSEDLGAAPNIRDLPDLNLTLVGAGAIGTGIVLLLDSIRAGGRLTVVDPQRFGPENLATYSIGDFSDVLTAPPKVEMVQRVLGRFDVTPIPDLVQAIITAVDQGELPWTETVLTALDSAEARRDAQRLWPDRLIDAQTGDTMLGMCDHRHGTDPCLICMFPVDRSSPSGADIVAEKLGLSHHLLADPEAKLTSDHLIGLTPEQQDFLRPHLGTPVCGLVQATGLSALDAGSFMPSVPFVSLQAACLSVSRLVAAELGIETRINFVQYDALYGPQAATLENMRPRPGCACQTRSESIETVRTSRRGRDAAP